MWGFSVVILAGLLKAREEEAGSLRGERAGLQREVVSLRGERAGLQREVDRLNRENRALREQLADLQEELAKQAAGMEQAE